MHFINETFKHCKHLAAIGNGIDLLSASSLPVIGLSNSTASTSPDEGLTSKIGSTVSKVAQKAVSAMTEGVSQNMEEQLGVVTMRQDDDQSVVKMCAGLKESMLKGRVWKREDDPRPPA